MDNYKKENEALLIQVEDFWYSRCPLDTNKNLQIEDLQSTSGYLPPPINSIFCQKTNFNFYSNKDTTICQVIPASPGTF